MSGSLLPTFFGLAVFVTKSNSMDVTSKLIKYFYFGKNPYLEPCQDCMTQFHL